MPIGMYNMNSTFPSRLLSPSKLFGCVYAGGLINPSQLVLLYQIYIESKQMQSLYIDS